MPCWSHRSETGVCSRRWSRSMATFSGTLKRFPVFLDMGKPPLEIVAYSSALFFPFRLKQNTDVWSDDLRRKALPLLSDVLPGFPVRFFRIVLVANASHRPMLKGPTYLRSEDGVRDEVRHCLLYEEMKQGIVSSRYAAAQVRFDSTGRWTHQAFCEVEKVLRIDRHLTVTSPDLVFKRGPQPDIRPTADLMAVQSLSHLRGQLGGRPPELCFGDGLFVCKYVYPDRRRPVRIAGQLVIPVHHPWREVDTSERRLHPLSLVRHRQVGCQDFKY